jgi:high-affinity nickel-transport protein
MDRLFTVLLAHRSDTRANIVGTYALLLVGNGFAWTWAFVQFGGRPVLLETALLAYLFGLRHAVDADHIAAIDNVVRKLMQEGQKPLAVGLFFSLGHSTVVALATVAVAASAATLQTRFEAFRSVGSIIGTGVSALFLFAIAASNLVILAGVWQSFRNARGGKIAPQHLDSLLVGRGVLERVFRALFRLVSKSWHMYPLGFLFGVGFDTATEIGLLGVSSAQVIQGMSLWSMLIFPALFAAGMVLVDTTDGVFMVGAYGWAFANPIRKLWYNLSITAVSVLAALMIGSIEVFALMADKLKFGGSVWIVIGELNASLGTIGFAVVFMFAACWVISALVYRWRGYDVLTPDSR